MHEIAKSNEAFETEAMHFQVEASLEDYCERSSALKNFRSAVSLAASDSIIETSYVTRGSFNPKEKSTTQREETQVEVAAYAELFGIDKSLVIEAKLFNHGEKNQRILGICVKSDLHQNLNTWIFFEHKGFDITQYFQSVVDIVFVQEGENQKVFGLRDVLSEVTDTITLRYLGTTIRERAFGGRVAAVLTGEGKISTTLIIPPPVGPEHFKYRGDGELRGVQALFAYIWPFVWLHEARHTQQKKVHEAVNAQIELDDETDARLERDASAYAFYENFVVLQRQGVNLLAFLGEEELTVIKKLIVLFAEFDTRPTRKERILCKVGEFVPAISRYADKQKIKDVNRQILAVIQDSPTLLAIFKGSL